MAVSVLRLHLISLTLCVLRVFGGPTVPNTNRCLHFNNCTYLLTRENLNWFETEKFCKRFQGLLPIPVNKVRMDFLSNKIDWKKFNVDRYWISLTKDSSTAGWKWKNASPLIFSNWNTKYPIYGSYGMPDCAYVSVTSQNKWEDMVCYQRKGIAAVCYLENHVWSSWSSWGDCNCNSYIQLRTRICGLSNEARSICPCPGDDSEKKLCSCLSRWRQFQKDDSRKKNFILIKRLSTENVVICSMFCLQEDLCHRFSFPGRNTCNLYKRSKSPVPAPTDDDTTDAYVAVDEDKRISNF